MCVVERSWVKIRVPSEDTPASILPSMEYVGKTERSRVNSQGKVIRTEPPVWRSQVIRSIRLSCVRKELSGEKQSSAALSIRGEKALKVLRRLRVTASQISTAPDLATATNLLHGDQAAKRERSSWYTVATTGSHEIGSPWTTLAKGHPYRLYTSRTIDLWGDRGSAEM